MTQATLGGLHVDLTEDQINMLNQFQVKDWTRFIVAGGLKQPSEATTSVDPGLLNVLYETDATATGELTAHAAGGDLRAEIEKRLAGDASAKLGTPSAGSLTVGFEGVIASAAVW